MNPPGLEPFRDWLEKEGLGRTSIRKVLTDLKTMKAYGSVPPESELPVTRLRDYRWVWSLWADYCEAIGKRNTLPRPAEESKSHHSRRRKKEPKRLKPAVSVPLQEWQVFLELVRTDESAAARVIDVLCFSGLRISDVLRTSAEVIDRGLARADGVTEIKLKGGKTIVYSVRGAPEEWTRLRAQLKPRQLVCDAVSSRGHGDWTSVGAAYQRCRRKLAELAEQAHIEDRIHLHRIRRTVAVQAALMTGDKFLVQKLLGHDQGETTETYLDESRAAEVAAVIAQMRKRFRR